MKVPTYKRQLQRTDRTGAGMLTAQLNPNVMAAPGQKLAQFGSEVMNFGSELAAINLKKQQLANKNESALAVQNFDTFIKSTRLEADKLTNPHEADAFFNDKIGNEYNRYLNTLSPGALKIFQIDGQKVASDLSYDFFKVNDPKILTHTKELAKNEVARTLEVVGNTDLQFSVRMNELFKVIGGKIKDTSGFNFTAIPTGTKVGYARGSGFTEGDSNLIMYHRQTISNGTFLENEDGSTTTVYIRGIKNPEEGANSPIYAVPGYFDGRKDWTEKEVVEKAMEEGWFDIYPSDVSATAHKRRVGKLKKIINKDGQTLEKIEKTLQLGINGKLFPDIIDYNEFQTLNMEALETAATNTLFSLMNNASDARDVFMELAEGNLKDPILNLALEKLPIEKRNSILASAKKKAMEIEDFKTKIQKEEDALIDKEGKEFYKKMINIDSYEEAKSRFDLLKEMNFFDTPTKLETALKFINKKKGGSDENWTWRTAEEGSVPSTIKDLARMDLYDNLSMFYVESVADELTQTDYTHYMRLVATERNDGITRAKLGFKNAIGYEEEMDVDDRLGKVVQATYFRAVDDIIEYVEQNPEATFRDVLAERDGIIEKTTQVYKAELERARAEDVIRDAKRVDGWEASNNLTNKEILALIEQKRWVDKPPLTNSLYTILKANYTFYDLKEVDQR